MRFVKSSGIKIYLSEKDKTLISSFECIENAVLKSNVIAFDIYNDNTLVGFVMLNKFAEDSFFLWDFAIDSNFQNQHYGEQALIELLNILKYDYNAKLITTTYKYGNTHAKYIYEKIGFVEVDAVNECNIHEVNLEIKL